MFMGCAKISFAVYNDPVPTGTDAAASDAHAAYSIPARVFCEGQIFIIGKKEKKGWPLRLTLSIP